MKHSFITTAALMACGAAQALTPTQIVTVRNNGTLQEIYLAGSSSQRLFIAAWFQQQCRASTFDVFFSGTGTATPGTNYRAYSCNLSKQVGNYPSGTPVLLVKRDAGDSFQGVNPIALALAQTNMLVDSSCTTANPSPATDIQIPSFACPNTQDIVADAGFSDVEPALMQRPVNLPDGQGELTNKQFDKLDIKTLNQTIFGLAVNKKLYRALQEDQGRIAVGGVIDEDPEKRPSLKKTWVAAALQGTAEGGEKKTGWDAAFDNDAADGSDLTPKQVNVCRQVVGSGTQAASNAYFLNIAYDPVETRYQPYGQGYNAAKSGSIGANQGAIQALGTKAVQLGSAAGNVETCLGITVEGAAGFAYGLGVLGRENNPTADGLADKGYRFVALDNGPIRREFAQVGDYDFVFNATMQWNMNTIASGSDKERFLSSLRINASKPTSLSGADVDILQGVMSPPSTYTGAYDDLTDPVLLRFSSRVDRINNNSGTALRIVK
jgi:hypothetical protein